MWSSSETKKKKKDKKKVDFVFKAYLIAAALFLFL